MRDCRGGAEISISPGHAFSRIGAALVETNVPYPAATSSQPASHQHPATNPPATHHPPTTPPAPGGGECFLRPKRRSDAVFTLLWVMASRFRNISDVTFGANAKKTRFLKVVLVCALVGLAPQTLSKNMCLDRSLQRKTRSKSVSAR